MDILTKRFYIDIFRFFYHIISYLLGEASKTKFSLFFAFILNIYSIVFPFLQQKFMRKKNLNTISDENNPFLVPKPTI
jgi:hypothetical protein